VQSKGGFSPKDKVRFWFALFLGQRLGSALNLFSGASEKYAGLGARNQQV
jgi:hypothetical protein